MISLIINPVAFFNTHSVDRLRPAALRGLAYLAAAAIILAIATYINVEEVSASYASVNYGSDRPDWLVASQRLLFPIAWTIIIFYSAMVRFLFARLQQADQIRFPDMLYVSMHAAIPLILVGFVLGLYYSFLPYDRNTGVGAAMSMAAVVVAFCWEGYICSAGFESIGGVSRVRAVLTWLAPALVTFCLCGPLLSVLVVIRSI